jgi:hypothetical protein
MRFIRGCLLAASYGLAFLGSAQSQTITAGEAAALSASDPTRGVLPSYDDARAAVL